MDCDACRFINAEIYIWDFLSKIANKCYYLQVNVKNTQKSWQHPWERTR